MQYRGAPGRPASSPVGRVEDGRGTAGRYRKQVAASRDAFNAVGVRQGHQPPPPSEWTGGGAVLLCFGCRQAGYSRATKALFCVLGVAGSDPMQSESSFDWTPLFPLPTMLRWAYLPTWPGPAAAGQAGSTHDSPGAGCRQWDKVDLKSRFMGLYHPVMARREILHQGLLKTEFGSRSRRARREASGATALLRGAGRRPAPRSASANRAQPLRVGVCELT
jgi:hypothetical protein